jgi:hypothetical protein
MKTVRIVMIAIILLSTQMAIAQGKSEKLFDSFANKDGITSFTFTKNMTDAFNIDLGENGEEQKITGDLNQIRFMSYNPKKGNLNGQEFINRAEALLPSQYKKFEADDNDGDADVFLLGNNRKFTEFLIFINNQEDDQMRFVISFTGDFTAKDLDGLKKTGRSFSGED